MFEEGRDRFATSSVWTHRACVISVHPACRQRVSDGKREADPLDYLPEPNDNGIRPLSLANSGTRRVTPERLRQAATRSASPGVRGQRGVLNKSGDGWLSLEREVLSPSMVGVQRAY